MENRVYWKTPLILSRIQFVPMVKRDGRVWGRGRRKDNLSMQIFIF